MLNNNADYKHEKPYKEQFVITWCWTNDTLTIQYVHIQIRHNISRIRPYTSDTSVEDINPKNMYDDVNILFLDINFCIILKLGHKVYN